MKKTIDDVTIRDTFVSFDELPRKAKMGPQSGWYGQDLEDAIASASSFIEFTIPGYGPGLRLYGIVAGDGATISWFWDPDDGWLSSSELLGLEITP